jgi:hypothetical protein
MYYRGSGILAVDKLDRRHTVRPRIRDNLLKGKGGGEEPNHTTAKKPAPLKYIKYSLDKCFQTCSDGYQVQELKIFPVTEKVK